MSSVVVGVAQEGEDETTMMMTMGREELAKWRKDTVRIGRPRRTV